MRKLPAGYEQYPPSEQIQMLLRDIEAYRNESQTWKKLYESTIELEKQASESRRKYGCERCNPA